MSADLQLDISEEFAPGSSPVPTLSHPMPAILADPDLWAYRERTIALLRRYLRISIEVGRLPSLLGRELFRSKVTSYRMSSFEDAVIFVHDVERALSELDGFAKQVIATVIFQDYDQDEAAEVLRCARRTICRVFPLAVDQMTETFLEGGLLESTAESACGKLLSRGSERRFCAKYLQTSRINICKVCHFFLFEMLF